MSPEVTRSVPLYMQIATRYKQMIMSGEIRPGEQLPSVRGIGRSWNVSHSVAQQVIGYLRTEGMARTAPDGTFALAGRVKYGPQQKFENGAQPVTERVTIRSAEIVPAPDYVVPIFGLEPSPDGICYVIRREWLTLEWDDRGEIPYKLSVTWCPVWARQEVPGLLDLWPLPPDGAARLIASSARMRLTGWKIADESRPIRNDGREGPLLYPGEVPGSILAKVILWWTNTAVLEYQENSIKQNKVTETEMAL